MAGTAEYSGFEFVQAQHHGLYADVNTSGSFDAISFDGVEQDSEGWMQVKGFMYFDLRAQAKSTNQIVKVEARYTASGNDVDGNAIELVNQPLTAGAGWTDFMDRADDSNKAALCYGEIRVLGQDDGDGSGNLEVEGGIT
jgi:hypothetical protein